MAAAKREFFTKASTLARDVYLVNLGIAGSAYERSQDLLKQTEGKLKESESKAKDLYAHRNQIFDSLVSRGEKVRTDASFFYHLRKAQAKAKLEEFKTESNAAAEERLRELRGNLEKVKEKISRKADSAAA